MTAKKSTSDDENLETFMFPFGVDGKSEPISLQGTSQADAVERHQKALKAGENVSADVAAEEDKA